MKRIEAIVRHTKVAEICAVLEKVEYPGLMITEIEGHGTQKGLQQEVRGKNSDVEKIVKAIQDTALTGKPGDGKIFISPVDDAVRIRTGERGDSAIK